jgi:hypothetical protein
MIDIAKRLIMGLLVFLFINKISAQELAPEFTQPDEEPKHEIGIALGLKLSTFGPGLELTSDILPKLHLRLGGSLMAIGLAGDSDFIGVTGSAEMKTGTISLFANYQVAKGFFVSGGVLYNMFEVSATGRPLNSFQLGVVEITPDKIGEVSFSITPGSKISPYVGLGLGRTISRDGIVSFAVEVGGVYHGKPKFDMGATGMFAPSANPENIAIIEDAISDFRFFPMINMQLSFRIFKFKNN